MNLAIRLTLDGLIRALKWKEHDLAEGAERRYLPRETVAQVDDMARPPSRPRGTRIHSDDRTGS